MSTLIIRNVDFELLEQQRILINHHFDQAIRNLNRESAEALEGIITMLNEWSDERFHKAEAKKKALESIPPGAIALTSDQAEARYRCSTCEEGGYCGHDCVEGATSSDRCASCNERVWFRDYTGDPRITDYTCPYCGTFQKRK